MSRTRVYRSDRNLFKMLGGSLIILAAFLLLATPAVYAASWDVTTDSPGATPANPNGAWSYGWETSVGGEFSLFTNFDNELYYSSPRWNQLDVGSEPIVWKNLGPAIDGVQTGELSLHPGSGGQYAAVRWTSSGVGSISLDGKFGAGDSAPESYFIYKDDSEIFKVLSASGDAPFSLNEAVAIGTTIDFIIGKNYGFGNTPLHATIDFTPVPIPGAGWLLVSGLLGLLGVGQRLTRS